MKPTVNDLYNEIKDTHKNKVEKLLTTYLLGSIDVEQPLREAPLVMTDPARDDLVIGIRQAADEIQAARRVVEAARYLAGDLNRRWTKDHPHRVGHLDPVLDALEAYDKAVSREARS